MIGTDRWVRPEAVLPDRALYFPTFSHFLIVNKTRLSSAPVSHTTPFSFPLKTPTGPTLLDSAQIRQCTSCAATAPH